MSPKTGLLHNLKDGQRYMDLWPMRKELNLLFPEHRIIKATRFAIKVMPAVAAICILTQMSFYYHTALPQAVMTALFALSLPVQGMWWLGHRANSLLPASLANWCREIHHSMVEAGCALEPLSAQPRYKELAMVLNRAFRQLDKTTLERWF